MLFTLKDAILDYFGKQTNKQLAKKTPNKNEVVLRKI